MTCNYISIFNNREKNNLSSFLTITNTKSLTKMNDEYNNMWNKAKKNN